MKPMNGAALLAGLLAVFVPAPRAQTRPTVAPEAGGGLEFAAGQDDWRKDLERAIQERKKDGEKARETSAAAKREREEQVLKAKDAQVLAVIGDEHRGTPHLYQRALEHPIWMGDTWGHYHAGNGDKIVRWQGRTYIITTKGKALEEYAGLPWNAGMSAKDKAEIARIFEGKETGSDVSHLYAQGARYQFEGKFAAGIHYISYEPASAPGPQDPVMCDVVPGGKIADGEKVVAKDYGPAVGLVYYVIGDGYIRTLRPDKPSRMHGFNCK